MKKIYCDICGKEMIWTPIKVKDIKECDYSVYLNDKYGKHPIDLCDDCSTNLVKMLKEEGKDGK